MCCAYLWPRPSWSCTAHLRLLSPQIESSQGGNEILPLNRRRWCSRGALRGAPRVDYCCCFGSILFMALSRRSLLLHHDALGSSHRRRLRASVQGTHPPCVLVVHKAHKNAMAGRARRVRACGACCRSNLAALMYGLYSISKNVFLFKEFSLRSKNCSRRTHTSQTGLIRPLFVPASPCKAVRASKQLHFSRRHRRSQRTLRVSCGHVQRFFPKYHGDEKVKYIKVVATT